MCFLFTVIFFAIVRLRFFEISDENKNKQNLNSSFNLELEPKDKKIEAAAKKSDEQTNLRFPAHITDEELMKIKSKIEAEEAEIYTYRNLKGREYERYIGCLLETQGYKVEYPGLRSGGGDGGIDLIARDNECIWIIQCKNFQYNKKVSPKDIQALYGAVEIYKRRHIKHSETIAGAFFANSGFSYQSWTDARTLNIKTFWVEYYSSQMTIPGLGF